MTKYKVHRDQAVWERESFDIEVPDDIPLGEHEDWIHEHMDDGDIRLHLDVSVEIFDSVSGMDTQTIIYRED